MNISYYYSSPLIMKNTLLPRTFLKIIQIYLKLKQIHENYTNEARNYLEHYT